jgi:hypothetical protein
MPVRRGVILAYIICLVLAQECAASNGFRKEIIMKSLAKRKLLSHCALAALGLFLIFCGTAYAGTIVYGDQSYGTSLHFGPKFVTHWDQIMTTYDPVIGFDPDSTFGEQEPFGEKVLVAPDQSRGAGGPAKAFLSFDIVRWQRLYLNNMTVAEPVFMWPELSSDLPGKITCNRLGHCTQELDLTSGQEYWLVIYVGHIFTRPELWNPTTINPALSGMASFEAGEKLVNFDLELVPTPEPSLPFLLGISLAAVIGCCKRYNKR